MIKRQFIYIFSISIIWALFMVAFSPLVAQDSTSEDSISQKSSDFAQISEEPVEDIAQTDTIPAKKLLSGVELKLDYGKLLLIWTEFETKYELGVNLRFYERIVLATEFGGATLNPLKAYDNALFYQVEGYYGRIGLDYYTTYDPSNFYYIGLRYAMSNFSDEGAFLLDSDFWPDYQEGFGSEDVTASWVEVILGTETYLKIGKKAKETGESRWLMGWMGRLRFLTDFENREEPTIYSIPGYGRTFNNYAVALNLYIKYRIGN